MSPGRILIFIELTVGVFAARGWPQDLSARWTVETRIDRLTGGLLGISAARTIVESDPPAQVNEIASCTASGDLYFRFEYKLPAGLSYALSYSVPMPGLRIVVNGGKPVNVVFGAPQNNAVAVRFQQHAARQEALEAQSGPNSDMSKFLQNFGKVAASSYGLADYDIRAADIFAARSLRIEIPLQAPLIVEIKPQEASFKEFATRCYETFPLSNGDVGDSQIVNRPIRFVPVSTVEVAAIEKWYWKGRSSQVADFSPRFKTPDALPNGTQWAHVRMIPPKNAAPLGGRQLGIPNNVAFGVGGAYVDLVRLQDGRFGLIPTNDWNPRPDHFVPKQDPLLNGSSWQPLPPPEKVFEGAAEEFIRVLPGMIERAATAIGADRAAYQAETAYTINLVKLCASVTAEMTEAAIYRNASGHRIMDLGRLADGRYKRCGEMGIGATAAPAGSGKRSLNVMGPSDFNFLPDGKTNRFYLSFSPATGDPMNTENYRLVVIATVHSD